MERFKALMGRKRRMHRLDFVRDMVTVLLTDREIYSDGVLFRDAVEEIYRSLREEVLDAGNRDAVEAYELAVLLRAVAFGRVPDVESALRAIEKSLSGEGDAF